MRLIITSASTSLPASMGLTGLPILLLPSPHSPGPLAQPELRAVSLQTSCASIPSSILRTCRRSPNISWCATWTPRVSRWGRHSFLRGRYWERPPPAFSSSPALSRPRPDLPLHLQVPVPLHGAAGRHAPQCGTALRVSPCPVPHPTPELPTTATGPAASS